MPGLLTPPSGAGRPGQPDVDCLLAPARKGRHGIRDDLLLPMLRIRITRLKNGLDMEQPVAGDELCIIKLSLARRQGQDALP